ncbi:Uncharacterised protein [Salmonella enterica subsp. enterica serovar Bovismorbificans]|uniref:Uncharacterized protein n=1 Tax=Salmonella enterica subsp. enterica serovar Bovismorbificans TaxID=58097 RepID=A0A655ELI6_SALET|nr:Uncharacterised protein [Salmonella enterica subsp. enterica serovar Bovismorbificans]CNV25302.1 Uncharacterised protein [Salmonella enterica subsp. enterica serovar Bovismorbificans]
MAGERDIIVTLRIRQQFNIQTAVFIRKKRQFKIVNRPRRQGMGVRLYARKIQMIIKHFYVEHRAK